MSVSDFHDKQRFLTVREAAGFLRVSKSFLDKLRSKDGGPEFFKIGNSVRYLAEDIEVWVQQHRFARTGEIQSNAAD